MNMSIDEKLTAMTGLAATSETPLTESDVSSSVASSFDEPSFVNREDSIKVAGLFTTVLKGAAKREAPLVQREAAKVEVRAAKAVEDKVGAGKAKQQKATAKDVERIQQAASKHGFKGMTPKELSSGKAEAVGGTPAIEGTVFNYEKYDENIGTTLEAVANHYDIGYKKMSIQEMVQRAKANGIGADYIGEISAGASSVKNLPVDVVRAHLTIPVIAKDLNLVADKLAKATDPAEIEVIHKQYENTRDTLLAAMYAAKGYQVPVAQAMRAMQEARPVMTGDLAKVIERDKLFAQALADTVGTKNMVSMLEAGSKAGFVKDLWMNTYINGMLSATGTHAINIASTGLFLAKQPIAKELAAFSGDVRNAISVLRGNGTIEDRVRHGEGLAGLVGMLNGTRDALAAAGGTLRTGKTLQQRVDEAIGMQSDPATWMEVKNVSGLNAADYGYEGATAMALTKWAQLVSLPGRGLATADDFFKRFAYGFEHSALAYRDSKAYQKSMIANGEDAAVAEQKAADRYLELMDMPSAEIDAKALDFGKMVTFSRDLDRDTMIGKFSDFVNDHTIAKAMFPFVRTPTWLVSEAAQHSPLAPLSRQWRADIAEGGAKRDAALAKMGEGTAVVIGLSSLVQDGTITGPGPFNPEVRKNYMGTGWRPFSIRFSADQMDKEALATLKQRGIEFSVVGSTVDPAVAKAGDVFVPYSQLAPLAGPLSMASAYYEYARYNKDPEDDVTEIAFATSLAVGELTKQIPVFTSVSDLVNAFSRTDKTLVRGVIDYATNQATKFAIEGSPAGAYSSLIAQTERFMNNQIYEIKPPPNMAPGVSGAYEAILRKMSRTPVLSSSMPKKLNFWGDPINANDPEYMPLSAINIRPSGAKNDPAFEILSALGIRAKDPDQFYSAKGVRVQLTNDQHYRLRQLFNKPFEYNGEQTTIKEVIVKSATSKEFLALPRMQQQTIVNDLIKKGRDLAEKRLIANPDGSLTSDGEQIIGGIQIMLEQMKSGSRDMYDRTMKAYE